MKQQLVVIAAFGGILGFLAAPPGSLHEARAQGTPTAQATRAPTPYDGLPTSQQTSLHAKQIANGELAAMSDAQVLAVFDALQP